MAEKSKTTHSFYSNFTSAIVSKENGTAMDMIAKEISDLMVDDFDNFIVTIGKSGIKISKGMTDEDIVGTILDKIDKNDKLIKLLAFAFADHNNVINNKKNDPTPRDILLWIKSTDTIADGIGKIAVNLKQDRTLKTTLKKNILEQIEDKAIEKGNSNRIIYTQRTNTTLYNKLKKDASKAFNYASVKQCSDADICTYLKKQVHSQPALSDAIDTLCRELKKDKGYRNGWVANIAMSYRDTEHLYMIKNGKKTLSRQDKITIATQSAEYFLELLCGQIKVPKGR